MSTATVSLIKPVCPECGETVTSLVTGRTGWALAVDPGRLSWVHSDGTPLCPVMTSDGYQPALPVVAA